VLRRSPAEELPPLPLLGFGCGQYELEITELRLQIGDVRAESGDELLAVLQLQLQQLHFTRQHVRVTFEVRP